LCPQANPVVTKRTRDESLTNPEEKDPEDLLQIFTRPIDEMTDDELIKTLEDLRKLKGKVRISTKKKTELDMILERLTPEQARLALEKLEPKIVESEEPEGKKE